MFLLNSWVKGKYYSKIRNYFEGNNSENMMHQNTTNEAKTVLKGKFIA